MKKENIKNIVILILTIIVIVLGVMLFISYNKDENLLCNETDNSNFIQNNDNKDIVENVETDLSKSYDIEDVKRDTKITGLGCDGKTTVFIENGNIILSDGEKKITFETENAKYIYYNGYMECATAYFFYITGDGKLYKFMYDEIGNYNNEIISLSNLKSGYNFGQIGLSSGDNIIGFLGTEYKIYEGGAEVSVIAVLNDKNEQKKFAYFTTYFN